MVKVGNAKGATTHFSVSDLKTDVSYNFRISAKNNVGTGPAYVSEEPIIAGKRLSKYCYKKSIFWSTIGNLDKIPTIKDLYLVLFCI